jgi:hypothetical protein
LKIDDRLGALQPEPEPGVVLLRFRQRGAQWVGLTRLRSAPGRCQAVEDAGLALAAPVGQGRGVETLAAQQGTDLAAAGSPVGLGQETQLVLGGKGPPPWPLGQLRIGRRRCRHDRRSPASFRAGAIGCGRLYTLVGHDHESVSCALKPKLRGARCLIVIGTEGFGVG